ncbi:DNA polymerase 1, putative [Plasmodium berghei]|uniref:DNA polymerase 1, putative n=2 Tax=Plasmodium berghei TaxID=5821 RepID=A0A509AMA7_PLABA|nr:DNA polymerase 1, putative [Plasmodium berghei ANKA]CXI64883.1 DNA polymerase 1, putative [Plasmodium berghei]SCM23907.1 DNA polymerase 1, putative [Plasmodium berghei]SCN26832.1 DNA polymerase 1, putative [Plasmodium berghei]SCO61206.1 DNA polymerase 1, putative [Plasmodium berghei]SCO63252.1 DNA polymerase 1, putative [Plasmodium berghei]|eukprot:XP_034422449.1 DNA polymerase 1, putative [Plasmodium berghei ANKA]
MKLFSIVIKNRNILKKCKNTNIQNINNRNIYIYNQVHNYCNLIDYNNIIHALQKKKENIFNEANSFNSLLLILKKYKLDKIQKETTHLVIEENETNNTHTLCSNKYNTVVYTWIKSVKIYISWFSEITDDKYKSKCFSLPTYLTFHVVIPNDFEILTDILKPFENYDFYNFLELGNNSKWDTSENYNSIKSYEKNETKKVLQKLNQEIICDDSEKGKNKNKNKIENEENYEREDNSGFITYWTKKDTDRKHPIIENVLLNQTKKCEQFIKNNCNLNVNQNKKEGVYKDNEKIYFFTFNINELEKNERVKEIINDCVKDTFSNEINNINYEKEKQKNINPFLFIVYDYKTLIHIFNNLKINLLNIKNVFDIYIISTLLQLVQRGEKLQNVFSSYTEKTQNDFLSFSNNEFKKFSPYFRFYSIVPPEFSDVLSGKFGVYGWGKYQKKKDAPKKKKNENKKNCLEKVDNIQNNDPNKENNSKFTYTNVKVKHINNIKKIVFGNKRSIYEITEEDMMFYCISRNIFLIILFNYLINQLKNNMNILTLYIKIEQPLIFCISEIEKEGIYLNQKKIQEIQNNSNNPLIYKKQIEELCGYDINLNSSKQVSSLLSKALFSGDFNPEIKNQIENSNNELSTSTKKLMNSFSINDSEDNIMNVLNFNSNYFDYISNSNSQNNTEEYDELNSLNPLYHKKSNYFNLNDHDISEKINELSNYKKNDEMNNKIKIRQYSNTINEMKRNKALQTNNKMLKIIIDELEKNNYIGEKEKEKIKQIINNIKLYRESKKLFQNYIENLPKHIQKNTKKIHCNFNQLGASTGRLSCDQPNLQNIHSKFRCTISLKFNELKPTSIQKQDIKNKSVNKNLLTFDYKQMELFVMAYLSFDNQLLKMLNNSDVFVETAKVLFNTNEVTKELRRMTKTVIYGILYGQSENGLAKNLLVSENYAKSLIDNFFNFYPNVYKFMQKQKILVKNINSVYTLIGRKRIVDPIIKNKYRISMNTPIQGCSADIMKFALLSCHKILSFCDNINQDIDIFLKMNNINISLLKKYKNYIKSTKLILQIHDELLFQCDENGAEDIIQLLKPVLENSFLNLIKYTNTQNRLLLLYDYMNDNISIQTYIENLKILNATNYTLYNQTDKFDIILRDFNLKLPIKAEIGTDIKE